MPSNLYQQLNPNQIATQSNSKINPQALQSIKNMMGMFKAGTNPQNIINMLVQQNPQLGQIIQMVNSSGMSPKNLFMAQAKQMRINPNEIINMLK